MRIFLSWVVALAAALGVIIGTTGVLLGQSLERADMIGFSGVLGICVTVLTAVWYVPWLYVLRRRGVLVRWRVIQTGLFTAAVLTLPAYGVLLVNARNEGMFAAGEAAIFAAAFAVFGFTFGALYRRWCLTTREA